MSENTEPLRKMTRAQLLEILVEPSKAVGEVRERMEQMEKQLQEKLKKSVASTRKTMAQYHNLIEQLAREAKKHE